MSMKTYEDYFTAKRVSIKARKQAARILRNKNRQESKR